MSHLMKDLIEQLEGTEAGSADERSVLVELCEALARSLHRYELTSIDRLYAELTEGSRAPGFLARTTSGSDAPWILCELLRAFLGLFPRPISRVAGWTWTGLQGQLLSELAQGPRTLQELQAQLGMPGNSIDIPLRDLQELGLLNPQLSERDHLEISTDGLRVETWLRRADASPRPEARRERYGDWRDRARAALLEEPWPSFDTLYQLRADFGPAFELARRDADVLPRSPSPRDLLQDLRHKLSLLRASECRFELLRPGELRQHEARLPRRSTVFVLGADSPNDELFEATLRHNLAEREFTYILLCEEPAFLELWESTRAEVGSEAVRRLHGVACSPFATGRYYNVTHHNAVLREGWAVQWLGASRARPATESGAFYSRVGDEYLIRVGEHFRHLENACVRERAARQHPDGPRILQLDGIPFQGSSLARRPESATDGRS